MSGVSERDGGYDAFIDLEKDKKNVGVFKDLDNKIAEQKHDIPKIHIVLEGKKISEDTLKSIQSDLEKIFTDVVKEKQDDDIEKIPKSEQSASYGKIQFSLDGLNLQAEAKEKLLEKLHFYATKKGLNKLEDASLYENSGEK